MCGVFARQVEVWTREDGWELFCDGFLNSSPGHGKKKSNPTPLGSRPKKPRVVGGSGKILAHPEIVKTQGSHTKLVLLLF